MFRPRIHRLLPSSLLPALALLLATTGTALANEPPEIVAPTAIARDPGQSVFFNVTTSDPDGDRVDLEAANLPPGSSFRLDGNGNGSFFWRPVAADEGFYLVTLIATDRGDPPQRTEVDLEITIGDPNLPPVLEPVADQDAIVGVTLVVPLVATDPEGDPLTFGTDGAPGGSTIRAGSGYGLAEFIYTPGPSAVGPQAATIVVSDGRSTDSQSFVVRVGAANVPPVLEQIGNRQVELGGLLAISLMAQDPDGDALRFDVQGLPEGTTLLDAGDGTARIEGVPTLEGVYGVTVTVTDDGQPAESAAETFEIEVLPAPAPVDPLTILEARFVRGWVVLEGSGAGRGAEVEIRDAVTGALVGKAFANNAGAFQTALRPLIPPCSVEAHVKGEKSAPVEVQGAPKACSQAPMPKVVRAVWDCRLGLIVAGYMAPPHSTVRVYRGSSSELLAVGTARRSGFFILRSRPPGSPGEIAVSAEWAGQEWRMDPTPVHVMRTCPVRRPGWLERLE